MNARLFFDFIISFIGDVSFKASVSVSRSVRILRTITHKDEIDISASAYVWLRPAWLYATTLESL